MFVRAVCSLCNYYYYYYYYSSHWANVEQTLGDDRVGNLVVYNNILAANVAHNGRSRY